MNRRGRTEALIRVIHSASRLEKLTMDYPAIKIEDMETLHAKAANLKHLEFRNGEIDFAYVGNQVLYNSAEGFESFSFQNMDYNYRALNTLGIAIRNWISYIGISILSYKSCIYIRTYIGKTILN